MLPQKITADEYMMEKMRALLEGRSMMEPVREKFADFAFLPRVTNNYDSFWEQSDNAVPQFKLRIPPNRPVDLNIAYPMKGEFRCLFVFTVMDHVDEVT